MAHKLLLADDSITIQKVVELVLAEEDFEIQSFSNGEDALKAMDSFRPDIVLADIDMPRINGYQLCEKVKQNPRTRSIPVILLAGAFEPIDDALASKVGADDSIIKPFESQELISKINSALTMVPSAAAGGEASFEAAGEEAIEIAEDLGAEKAEPVSAAAEEDLWAIDEIPGEAEKVAAGIAAEAEESGIEEAFEIAEESFEQEDIPSYEEPKSAVASASAGGRMSAPRAGSAAPEVEMPSRGEVLKIVEAAVRERVAGLLSASEIKDSVTSSLGTAMKDSVEKVLWEVAPDLVEKMLRNVLKDSVSAIATQIEKVIWETVPDLASNLISKEIEKIKSEF